MQFSVSSLSATKKVIRRGSVSVLALTLGMLFIQQASAENLRVWLKKQKGQTSEQAAKPGFGTSTGNSQKKLKSQEPLSQPAQTNFNGGLSGAKATTETEVVVDKSVSPMLSPTAMAGIQNAVTRYEIIAARGGWQSVASTKLAKGAQGKEVTVLKRRLVAEGYLPESTLEGEKGVTFTTALEQALKQFQINHGLAATGRLDKATQAALNVPVQRRLTTLRANLPRVAEYSRDLSSRYIVVNVPALQLEAVQNGRVYSRHNVIAGKPERPSPIVMANLSDINFNPYWNVPVSIVERDLIPQILKGGTQTLKKQNIRIYDGYQGPEVDPDDVDWSSTPADRYHFRQDPGKDNAMATMKINFPSPFGVYMHDTPTRSLFGTAGRYLSSGCVRVEKVPILVNWVLNGQEGWNQSRIAEMAESLERLDVKLIDPPQLRWVYLTAWATATGQVNFRDDIYELDGTGFIVGQPMPVGEYSEDGKRYVLKPIPHTPAASPVDSLSDNSFDLFGDDDTPRKRASESKSKPVVATTNFTGTKPVAKKKAAKVEPKSKGKTDSGSAFSRLQKNPQTASVAASEEPKTIKKKKKKTVEAAKATPPAKPDEEPLFGQD